MNNNKQLTEPHKYSSINERRKLYPKTVLIKLVMHSIKIQEMPKVIII